MKEYEYYKNELKVLIFQIIFFIIVGIIFFGIIIHEFLNFNDLKMSERIALFFLSGIIIIGMIFTILLIILSIKQYYNLKEWKKLIDEGEEIK